MATIEKLINTYVDEQLNNSDNFKDFFKSCSMYLSAGELADLWVEKWSKYAI
jgi:hypothetical protein